MAQWSISGQISFSSSPISSSYRPRIWRLRPKQARPFKRNSIMAQTALDRVKDAVFTRLMPAYRPILRIIETTLPWASALRVSVCTGKLRFIAVPAGQPIRIQAAIRTREVQIANAFEIAVERTDRDVAIDFNGEFVKDGNTCASVDALIFLPQDVALAATSDLGPIDAIGCGKTVDVTTALGHANVILAPGWSGERLDITSHLGHVKLTVPRGLELCVDAETALGKRRVEIASHPDAPVACLRASLGSVTCR